MSPATEASSPENASLGAPLGDAALTCMFATASESGAGSRQAHASRYALPADRSLAPRIPTSIVMRSCPKKNRPAFGPVGSMKLDDCGYFYVSSAHSPTRPARLWPVRLLVIVSEVKHIRRAV